MIRLPGGSAEENPKDRFREHCYENSQQVMQILDQAPTAAEPLIREGFRGYFNNKVYEMVGGVLYEHAVSPTA